MVFSIIIFKNINKLGSNYFVKHIMKGSVLKIGLSIDDFFGFDLIRFHYGLTIDLTLNHESESSIYILFIRISKFVQK